MKASQSDAENPFLDPAAQWLPDELDNDYKDMESQSFVGAKV